MDGWMDGWMDGEDLITWLAEKMDLDLRFDLIWGGPRPLFQAAVGRPGPDFGPAGPMLGCTGRVFGATDLLGRPWGQIGPIWGPFRGRPTLENHAPA